MTASSASDLALWTALLLVSFVSTGVPGSMPGFETRLSPEEIEAVVDYVWVDLSGR